MLANQARQFGVEGATGCHKLLLYMMKLEIKKKAGNL